MITNKECIDKFTVYKHNLDILISELNSARHRLGIELNSDIPNLAILNSAIMNSDIHIARFKENKGKNYG